jgi:hypothetical protein
MKGNGINVVFAGTEMQGLVVIYIYQLRAAATPSQCVAILILNLIPAQPRKERIQEKK